MPTYHYECPSCNGYSEHVVRFDDPKVLKGK